jgi:hypothetical protein
MNSDLLVNHLRPWVLALMIVATSPTLTMAWNPFVPEPIFDAFLAPMFAECGCPAYGIEDVRTWEDNSDPTITYYDITVVLSVNLGPPQGWYGESQEYLFKIVGNGPPTIEAIGETEPWPADAMLAY